MINRVHIEKWPLQPYILTSSESPIDARSLESGWFIYDFYGEGKLHQGRYASLWYALYSLRYAGQVCIVGAASREDALRLVELSGLQNQKLRPWQEN